MISDVHNHCMWSSDSVTDPEIQVKQAITLGMKHICITDHLDIDAPGFPPDFFNFLIGNRFDDETFRSYFDNLTSVKEKYKDSIELLIGVEFGMQPHLVEQYEELHSKYPWDMIIGSTHTYQGMDGEDKRHYENVSNEEALRAYFEEELLNLQIYDCYDTVGHMDFAIRYAPGAINNFQYSTYSDILDEILKVIIRKDKALEINTSKLKSLGYTNPQLPVFERYWELGGRLITFGSDAHVPERLGEGFEEMAAVLKKIGFKEYAVFRKHMPVLLEME